MEVTIREVENIGTIIADALAAGVTNYDGLSFSAMDTEQAYDAALEMAVADAQRKAEAIAGAAGRELVGIMKIEEQTKGDPMAIYERALSNASGIAADNADGISTGEITTNAGILVTYEIK